MIIPFRGVSPKISPSAFIAPDAWVIGDVTIGDGVSVFFGAVLRGDIMPIVVGNRSNVQEHAMIHTSYKRSAVVIGEDVTVGHRATIHGACIGDRTLVGMGSICLDDAMVEEESIVGAGALLKEGMHVPKRSLVIGVPGKIVRSVSDEEVDSIVFSASRYVETGLSYMQALKAQQQDVHP